jgi:hypothetical protein
MKKLFDDGITPTMVIKEFVEKVRDLTRYLPNVIIVYDTCGFDFSFMSSFMDDDYCPSMNFLLWDHAKDKPKYSNSIDKSSFECGVIIANHISGFDNPFKRACLFHGIHTMPTWPVSHDHNPMNDAITIGLEFAFICCLNENSESSRKAALKWIIS